MNNLRLTAGKPISKLGTLYDVNPVMQIIGKQQYIDLTSDDQKVQELNTVIEAVHKEVKRNGIYLSDAMVIAYTLGVIHGKQVEREKKKSE